MCIGIFSIYTSIHHSESAHLHIVTQEDGSGPGHVDGPRTRTRTPTSETRRAGTQHHNNKATGVTGVNWVRHG